MTPTPNNEALAALKQIADMDPQGIRADDLGRAARIAREALASSGQAASAVPTRDEMMSMAEQAGVAPNTILHFEQAFLRFATLLAKKLAASPTQPASAPARKGEGEVMDMALCESQRVVLREGQLYRFRKVGDCETCASMSAASLEAYATPAAPAQPRGHIGSTPWGEIDDSGEDTGAMETDAVDTLVENGWIWDGDQWQRPPAPRAPSIEPDSVLASFKPMEREVLAQLAQEQEMSEAAVLRQALRIYQAVRLGAIKLQHPRPLGMMTFGAAPASQAESSTPRIEPVGEVERNAFDNWCRKRYPLADADDVADTFCDALWGCWQARAALATPTKSVSGVEEFPLPEARETAEPWGYATKAFGWGLVSKQVYDSVLASHGSDWAVKLYTTPPAPRAPSIEPVGEALERLTLWARTQVGRCECTGDHPIADAERALGWRK